MARSSFGSRRAMTWTAEQSHGPTLRIVRLGRAANDNIRPYGQGTRVLFVVFAATLAVMALVHWGMN
ncbi:hypothetical protein BH11PSE3_BH11PSE3_10700 [soil metagenome]